VESALFYIPSTSFCSLSSWFTSSCAYHLIIITTFALTIYHSRGLSPQIHKYFPPYIVFLVPLGLRLGQDLVGTDICLFVLVSKFKFLSLFLVTGTCARLSWPQSTLSFSIHVKLSYRVVILLLYRKEWLNGYWIILYFVTEATFC